MLVAILLPFGTAMSIHEDLELLDQTQTELEQFADSIEESVGIDRRDFMFWSLVTAAATTFGFGSRALAQAPTGTTPPPQTPTPPPLGNGEPISWTFQPYPGGTGALMEKLVREHGAAVRRRPDQQPRGVRSP